MTLSHATVRQQRGESHIEKPADEQKLLTHTSVADVPVPVPVPVPKEQQQEQEKERKSHESTKTLLTVAAIGAAIIYNLLR